jgi:hypothetical protein
MKSLEIVSEKLSNGEEIIRKKGNYYLLTNEQLKTIKQDLEILELVRGKSFFFHLSKQELKKVNKWLEENE